MRVCMYVVCMLCMEPYHIMLSIEQSIHVRMHIICTPFFVVYYPGRIHSEVQRRPYPRAVVEGLVHNGLVADGVDVKRRVRAKGDGSHDVCHHAERSLAVRSRVEEGQIAVVDENSRSPTP